MTNQSYATYSAGGYFAYSPGGLSAYKTSAPLAQYVSSNPAAMIDDLLRYSPVPARGDTIDDLLVGKAAFLGKRLEEIQNDIMGRDRLLEDNLYQLEQEICQVDSRIYHLLQLPEVGEARTLAQKKASLYGRLADLEKEKRGERVSCWADTCRLKKDLFDIAELYKSAKRREGLWGDLNGAD